MATTSKPVDVLADFKVAPAHKVQYEPAKDSPSVPVPAISASAKAAGHTPTVHRGKRVRDGLPCVYVQDGSAQPFALPLVAIGAMIAGGLITREQIAALTA